MSLLNVNTEEIQDDFPLIPAGTYNATISLVDFATDKDTGDRKEDKNHNEYLKGDFVIVEGDFANQHVFLPYMRTNQQLFRDMCYAAGKRGLVNDTEELTGLPLMITVKEELYRDKMQSKVSGFVVA